MQPSGGTDNSIGAGAAFDPDRSPLDVAGRLAAETELDAAFVAQNRHQRLMLAALAALDDDETWEPEGCYDFAHWVSKRLGISSWVARRWINTGHALARLPRMTAAFEAGDLCLDKVIELSRFATVDTEKKLITWARRVTLATVRARADVENSRPRSDLLEDDRSRYLSYWWSEGRTRLAMQGSFPADQGAVVAKALDRLAGRLPDIIDSGDGGNDEAAQLTPEESLDIRRADALVALASTSIAKDQDPDRATVVIHAELEALAGDECGCEIEGGPVIHPETARRLACDSRLQVAIRDRRGRVVGVGHLSRTAPRWLLRQLRYRDRGCTFPGCPMQRFLHAHHIWHWVRGGPTDLDNLVLVCTFHHKLVHEYGWNVELGADGMTRWFRPGGREFERAPPRTVTAAA